jgi:hypothetical protein
MRGQTAIWEEPVEALNREDVPVAIEDDSVELRMSEVGDMTVSFIALKEGADLGPALVGLPDDLCPCPHWGYMLKGRLKMSTSTSPRPRSSRR